MPPARLTYDSPALSRVARGDLCAGCGACAALAPDKVSIAKEAPGYLRPVQLRALNDDEEQSIAAACPGLGQTVKAGGRTAPVLWGPYLKMMVGWAEDADIRFSGASGGGLSALLVHLVESGTVDAIVQTAADPDLAIGNKTVVTSDRDAITEAAGSRYAPSAPLESLPERLAEHAASGRRFAFVGKPCDAVALRAMRDRDATIADAFPVILSFFCAGVPSHRGGEEVLEALGTDLSETASFRFRGNGWPGRATATDQNGIERSMSYHDSWGRILNRHVQHRCKICADGTGMAADIVCADAWETDAKGYPLFKEAPGISLIVARTDLGSKLVAEAVAAGHLRTNPFNVSDLAAMQPGQEFRRQAVLVRLLALRLTGRPVPHYEGLQIVAAARQEKIARHVRTFFGTLRRTLRPKR